MPPRQSWNSPEIVRLPQPPAARPAAGGFVVCPGCLIPLMSGQQWQWQQMLYLAAYREAQAVVRPSLPERDLLGVWN